MTAQHDSNSGANAENGQGAISTSTPIPARRRILVRGAAASLPTILTLHSGAAAAVARTSNVIGVSDGPPTDAYYRCVDESSFTRDGTRLDLGEDPDVNVTVIRKDGRYFKLVSGGDPVQVGGPEMCSTGGTFVNEAGQDVVVNRGALVSAAALMSFAGRATFNTTNI